MDKNAQFASSLLYSRWVIKNKGDEEEVKESR